jgi:hypothetical protein
MAVFPYTQVPGKLKQFLAKIREIGVPPKVTVQSLKTLGFKSSNDATLIPVLKFIGFLDQSGTPTTKWSQYRGAKARAVLGAAIQEGYSALYDIYPDAHKRSQEELEDVFSTSSSAGKAVIQKTVTTFRALAGEADFVEAESSLETLGPLHAAPVTHASSGPAVKTSPLPSLHIDLQIHISPESSPEQIEQIFASMAKHLYGAAKAA